MQRNTIFDIMKGIGILAVIAGHSFHENYIIHQLIYSFHIPLFFILAGYFYKENYSFYSKLKNDFKRLIIPYLITAALLVSFLTLTSDNMYTSLKYGVVAILWAQGGTHTSHIWSTIPRIGPLWFLVALFWCRTCYNIIVCYKMNKYIFVPIISILAVITDRYLINLPFCLLPGISAMLFYLIGNTIRTQSIRLWQIALLGTCWGLHIKYSEIDLCICLYRYYIIDIFAGIFGTWLIYQFSNILNSLPGSKWTAKAGEVSLTILCIHTLEFYLIDYHHLVPAINQESEYFCAHTLTCLILASAWYQVKRLIPEFTCPTLRKPSSKSHK